MRGLTRFVAVAAAVVGSSAVLAPLLHRVLPFPFPRIFTRLLMIGTLAALIASGRFSRETLSRIGFGWRDDSRRLLAAGAACGLLGLLALLAIGVGAGPAAWAPRDMAWWKWVEKIGGAVLTAVAIALAEELIFRGWLFTTLRDRVWRGRAGFAMVATSVVYALLHFITLRKPALAPEPGLSDSLTLVLLPFTSMADWPAAWPSAVGLLLFGMALNAAAARSGSLWPSVGLHAGAVFVLRAALYLVSFPSEHLLWGSKRIYDGAAGWVFIAAIGAALYALARPGRPRA